MLPFSMPSPAVYHWRTILSRLPEHLHSVNEVEDGEDLVRHPIVWPGQVVQVHHFTSQVSLQRGEEARVGQDESRWKEHIA